MAQLVLRAPSYIQAFFPLHVTPSGRGVRMHVELEHLESLLAAELAAAHRSAAVHTST